MIEEMKIMTIYEHTVTAPTGLVAVFLGKRIKWEEDSSFSRRHPRHPVVVIVYDMHGVWKPIVAFPDGLREIEEEDGSWVLINTTRA